MSSRPEAVFEAALQLSEDQRLALVSRLLETLPSEELTASVDDPQLIEELDRRFATSEGAVPWSELRSEG